MMSAMPSSSLDFRNVNSLWGSVLVETLARGGLQQAVVSPGSRSTPLTIAFARHPRVEAVPVLDERSAAFFALGLAKRSRRPVALLCTSGTAGANYFPAIIEARESGVPLFVLTADRPPEMRACASGQTIDQQKLYGDHVSFYHELAVPEATVERLSYLRQTIAHALARTLAPNPGPVHVNAPFRDPLPPVADATTAALAGVLGNDFFSHLDTAPPVEHREVAWARPATARGIIFSGATPPGEGAAHAMHVLKLAEALGWPVLADALSPLRHYAGRAAGIVTAYDAILRNAAVARDLRPRTVLCLGGWPTSKVLRSWLEGTDAEILLVASSAANRDALHGRTRQVVASVESLVVTGEKPADDGYAEQWRAAETTARGALDRAMAAESSLFEAKAAWLLARALPAGTPVFVANSMPVRDVEYFWGAGDWKLDVYFSRGANGIDGTLSTALGIAHGAAAPAVLLTGDLALLHDSNGFLLRAKLRGALTVVLINNAGGGIFEHLPIAAFDPPFEEFFATPQAVDFATLCAAHGVEHVTVRDWVHFTELITTLPRAGMRVLEVRTDRKRDAALRKRWFADAAAGL